MRQIHSGSRVVKIANPIPRPEVGMMLSIYMSRQDACGVKPYLVVRTGPRYIHLFNPTILRTLVLGWQEWGKLIHVVPRVWDNLAGDIVTAEQRALARGYRYRKDEVTLALDVLARTCKRR